MRHHIPCMMCGSDIHRKAHERGTCPLNLQGGGDVWSGYHTACRGCTMCCGTCSVIQNAHSSMIRSYACCRNAPSRMEGDPRARIAPWGSDEERTAHSEDSHSSPSPDVQQRAQDAQPSSGSAPAHGEGEQAGGWGDVGDFSLGTLDAPSIAADDPSGKVEAAAALLSQVGNASPCPPMQRQSLQTHSGISSTKRQQLVVAAGAEGLQQALCPPHQAVIPWRFSLMRLVQSNGVAGRDIASSDLNGLHACYSI